jgi:hypothetical protein
MVRVSCLEEEGRCGQSSMTVCAGYVYTTCSNIQSYESPFNGLPPSVEMQPDYLAHLVDVYRTTARESRRPR